MSDTGDLGRLLARLSLVCLLVFRSEMVVEMQVIMLFVVAIEVVLFDLESFSISILEFHAF